MQQEDSAVSNDESTQGENSVVSTETCVPNVSNVPNPAHSTGEVAQQAIETAPTSLEM